MTDNLYKILFDYNKKLRKIDELDSEIEALETILMPSGIRYDKDKIQTSPSDAMSEIISKISDLQNKREKLLIEATEAMDRLTKFINQIEDDDERLIAKYYYINGYTWKEITKKFNFEHESTTFYHRRKIINELEKLVVISSI